MTEPAKKFALGILASILAGVALPIVFAQWNGKVDRSDFDLHVQREEAKIEAVLDLLCEDKPTHRRCR